MDQTSNEFLSPVGPSASSLPARSTIFNIAQAATTSVATDLTGTNFTGLKAAIDNGCYITLTASVDIWYRWASATGTVDETTTAASTPANQGILLPAGASVRECPPLGTTFLLSKATPSAGTLCVQISSRSKSSKLFGGVSTI